MSCYAGELIDFIPLTEKEKNEACAMFREVCILPLFLIFNSYIEKY